METGVQNPNQSGAKKKPSLKVNWDPSREESKGDSPVDNTTHEVMWIQEAQKWALISCLLKAVGKKIRLVIIRNYKGELG